METNIEVMDAVKTAQNEDAVTNNEQVWVEELTKPEDENPYLPKREISQRPLIK